VLLLFLYADDIILPAPSVQALQSLVNICNSELSFLDMAINPLKNLLVWVLARNTEMFVPVSWHLDL